MISLEELKTAKNSSVEKKKIQENNYISQSGLEPESGHYSKVQ